MSKILISIARPLIDLHLNNIEVPNNTRMWTRRRAQQNIRTITKAQKDFWIRASGFLTELVLKIE